MLPDYDVLFANQAEKYDRLVSAEDHEGNLLRTLRQCCHLNRNQSVADLGSGTGRMAYLFAPVVRHVYGIEPVSGMRQVAEAKRQKLNIRNVDFLPEEHKSTSLPDHCVDVIVEGWAFLKAYNAAYPEWRAEFQAIVAEMRRILRPGGTVALIETMGTLNIWSVVPERVSVLYEYFAGELDLQKTVVRTDYRFCSVDDAVDLCTFFFGDEAGAEVAHKAEPIVHEATAIWHGTL